MKNVDRSSEITVETQPVKVKYPVLTKDQVSPTVYFRFCLRRVNSRSRIFSRTRHAKWLSRG